MGRREREASAAAAEAEAWDRFNVARDFLEGWLGGHRRPTPGQVASVASMLRAAGRFVEVAQELREERVP